MRRFTALLLALALSGAAFAQIAPTTKSLGEPKTALYVGNSFFYYNNGMPGMVGRLLAAAVDPQSRPQYRTTMATISGSGLNWHDVESYLKPGGGMASYSFTADNKVVFNKFDRPFDVVVMMD